MTLSSNERPDVRMRVPIQNAYLVATIGIAEKVSERGFVPPSDDHGNAPGSRQSIDGFCETLLVALEIA
jgi:hypothetical protein